MTLNLANQLSSARLLNDAIPRVAVCPNDVSVVSSTTLVDVPGLVVPVRANAYHLLKGYLAYTATAATDFKFSLTVPPGASGHWGVYGQDPTATGSVGGIYVLHYASFGDSVTAGVAGSDSFSNRMVCLIHACIVTNTYVGGDVVLRFSQNTSNATAATIKAGSWMRIDTWTTYNASA